VTRKFGVFVRFRAPLHTLFVLISMELTFVLWSAQARYDKSQCNENTRTLQVLVLPYAKRSCILPGGRNGILSVGVTVLFGMMQQMQSY
jgi:hypothetical protein